MVASPAKVVEKGSSPLTRGKRVPLELKYGGARLIPAHAGKTRSSQPASNTPTAHPRSRGENRLRMIASCPLTGSSPLTRGKLALCRPGSWRGGLIPAHAGKTRSTSAVAYRSRAHPRSRGENDSLPGCTTGWEGSSPLTRGKPDRGRSPADLRGLIPAHAGKTRRSMARRSTLWAHPRSRGENAITA